MLFIMIKSVNRITSNVKMTNILELVKLLIYNMQKGPFRGKQPKLNMKSVCRVTEKSTDTIECGSEFILL